MSRKFKQLMEERAQPNVEPETLRQHIRSVVSTLPDVVWSVALPSREVCYASPAVAAVFGRAEEEFYAKAVSWDELIHPDDIEQVLGVWDQAAQGGIFEAEHRALTPGGETRWIHSRGHTATDAEGRIVRMDGISRDVTERREQERKIAYLMHYDSLTGLPNRALFQERVMQLLEFARKNQAKVTVVVGDVKRFRQINETFGRKAGDIFLQELGQRIKTSWPEPANIARISADCFAGILVGIDDVEKISQVIDKSVAAVHKVPFFIRGKEVRVTPALGVAVFPEDGDDADTLFKNAEAALKKAKATGERFLFYRPEINAQVAETLLLENKLRKAIDEEQFVLHYQPKIHAMHGGIAGFEALIRWQSPEHGLVPPGQFIPLLENTDMILEVGPWAIRKALADSGGWRLPDGSAPRIAVNVSPIQLQQRDFVKVVRHAMEGFAAKGCALDLEITESLIMSDIDQNLKKLAAIGEMGVKIAIDDFGTGYSSLGYLAKLPVHALKIDRSFVDTMTSSSYSMTIVSTIISLARAIGLKVIAEGVETREQEKYLRLLKCDELQGYLFSVPLPPEAVGPFLLRSPLVRGG